MGTASSAPTQALSVDSYPGRAVPPRQPCVGALLAVPWLEDNYRKRRSKQDGSYESGEHSGSDQAHEVAWIEDG